MLNLNRLKRKIAYYFTKTDLKFNDKVPAGHLTIDQIPNVIFERDVLLVNCGVHSKLKSHIVTATALNFNTSHGVM